MFLNWSVVVFLKLFFKIKQPQKRKKRVLSLLTLAIAEDYNQEGDARLNKDEFADALDFYTKGIELKCNDDQLNATMYTNRARVHFCVGKPEKHASYSYLLYLSVSTRAVIGQFSGP